MRGNAAEVAGIARDHGDRTGGLLQYGTDMGVSDREVEGVPDGCGAIGRCSVERRSIGPEPVEGGGRTGRPAIPARFNLDGGWYDETDGSSFPEIARRDDFE